MRRDIRNMILWAAVAAAPAVGSGCSTIPDDNDYYANYPPPPVYVNGRWAEVTPAARDRSAPDRRPTPAEQALARSTPSPDELAAGSRDSGTSALYAAGDGGPGTTPSGTNPANGQEVLGPPPVADTTGVRFAELPAVRKAIDSAQPWQQAEQLAAGKIDAADLRQNLHEGMAALAPRIARALVDRKGDVAVVTVAVYREADGPKAAGPQPNAGAVTSPASQAGAASPPAGGPPAATAPDSRPINPLLRAPETAPGTAAPAGGAPAGEIAHDNQPPATVAPAVPPPAGGGRDVAIAIAFEGFGKALEASYLPRVLSDQPRPPDDAQNPGPNDPKAVDPKVANASDPAAAAQRPATGPAGDANLVLDGAATSYIVYRLGPDGLAAGVVSHDELRGQVSGAVAALPPRQGGAPQQGGVAQGPSAGERRAGAGATFVPSDRPTGDRPADPSQPGPGATYVPSPDNGGPPPPDGYGPPADGPVAGRTYYDPPAYYPPSYYDPPVGGYYYDPYAYGPTYWGPVDDPFLYDLYGARWGSRYFVTTTGYYYGSPWYYSRRHGWNHRPDRDYDGPRDHGRPGNGGGGAVAGRRPARSEVPWARPPVVSPTLPTLASTNGGRPGSPLARASDARAAAVDSSSQERLNLQRAAIARTLAADRATRAAVNRGGADGAAGARAAGNRGSTVTPLDIPATPAAAARAPAVGSPTARSLTPTGGAAAAGGRNNAARPPGYDRTSSGTDRPGTGDRSAADRPPNTGGRVSYKQPGGPTITFVPRDADKADDNDAGPKPAASGSRPPLVPLGPQRATTARPQNNAGSSGDGPRFNPGPQLDDVPRAVQDTGRSSRGSVQSSPRSGGGDNGGSRRAGSLDRGSAINRGDMGNGSRGDTGPRSDPSPSRAAPSSVGRGGGDGDGRSSGGSRSDGGGGGRSSGGDGGGRSSGGDGGGRGGGGRGR